MPTRSLRTVLVCAFALTAGACAAGRAIVIAPAAAPIVVTAETAEPDPESDPEIALLPLNDLRIEDLMPPVTETPIVPTPEPKCDIAAVVAKTATDPVLKAAPLTAGTKLNRYIEVRIGAVRPYKDYVKDVALRVLDLDTCTTQVITITKTYGTRVIPMPVKVSIPKTKKTTTAWKEQVQPAALVKAPRGWDIEVVRRANGIEWNNWATDFRINAPANKVVVGLKYPIVEEAPRKGTPRITEFTYVPHGEALLEIPELVARGPRYGADVHARASDILRNRGVMSKALPGTLVTDVPVLTAGMSFRRIANEHMDQLEFTLKPDWATRRIFMVIGANGDQFGSRTCSPANACGPRQFIPDTWSLMASVYPGAKLQKKFTTGASDAVEATMASILLDDNNLHSLIDAFGPGIMDDPRLEEYLTAAYNTGVGRVITVLRIAQQKNIAEWTEATGPHCRTPAIAKANGYDQCLLTETKGYIAKLRYLKEEWPKEQPVALKP